MENKISGVKYTATKFSAFCFEWLEALVPSLVVFVILLTFFFRVISVDGHSMEDTLHHGDKLIVTKWNYTPKKGNVVVITRGITFEKPIVKRVIATGGDTFKIRYDENLENGCEITVNGEVLNESYIKEKMYVQGDLDFPSVIPEGKAVVMGDNRNRSYDGRHSGIGLIPYDHIVGKASQIVFPFSRFGSVK